MASQVFNDCNIPKSDEIGATASAYFGNDVKLYQLSYFGIEGDEEISAYLRVHKRSY